MKSSMLILILLLSAASAALGVPAQLSTAIIKQNQDGFDLQLFLSDEIEHSYQRLPFDEKNKTAARFFIDLFPVEPGAYFALPAVDGNHWIQNIRIGKNAPDKMRLVLDLTSLGEKQDFVVTQNSKGVLIKASSAKVPASDAPTVKNKPVGITLKPKVKKAAPERKTPKKTYRIVIDPGHGGADPGASGLKGNKEKNVVLAISKRVRNHLSKKSNYVTFMTRDKDKTLKLQERTRYANAKSGDLFVSIHANASSRRSAKGVSTYFLNNADDQESLRVAMRENGELDPSNLRVPSGSDDYYLEIMKASMIKNFHTSQSTDLARAIQKKMMGSLSTTYKDVVNLGVRSARFYVLTGTKMPAVLVETSFISNPTEEKRLTSSSYQEKLAKAIVAAVETYMQGEIKTH